MSRFKYLAAKALASRVEALTAFLGSGEASLDGRVNVLQQMPDQEPDYPEVGVLPGGFKFIPWNQAAVKDSAGDAVVNGTSALVDVGELAGKMQVWIGARYPVDREAVEDAILALFFEDENAPGTVQVTVSDVTIAGVATGYDVILTFSLLEEEWTEEMVFSVKRWASLSVEVELPILVWRSQAPLITSMQMAITNDVAIDISGAADPDEVRALLSDLEEYEVDETGDLTEV
jgi:hypothetical protein